MADQAGDQTGDTQTKADEGLKDDTQKNDEPTLTDKEKEAQREKELLADKQVQGMIDRRVSQALDKKELETKQREAAAHKKAQTEAQEAQLLEDEKYKELADLKTTEAETATTKLAEYEHKIKVDLLLDKKEVLRPKTRELFCGFGGDLMELDSIVDDYLAEFQEAVEAAVNQRLQTKAPPKGDGDEVKKPEAKGSLNEQLKVLEVEAQKTGDWTKHLALAEKISDQIARQTVPVVATQPGD